MDVVNNTVKFNYTFNYPSPPYKKGVYRMDVTVYKEFTLIPIPIGSAFANFELTGRCIYKFHETQNA